VPNRAVAADARIAFDLPIRTRQGIDLVRQPLVAVSAVLLHHAAVVLVHLNLIGEIPSRERQRMEESVSRLAVILAHEVVRSVAIIARGELAVRRLHPTVELFPHDVAIHTRLGIVRHIGRPIGVAESENSESRGRADQHGNQHVKQRDARDDLAATSLKWPWHGWKR
jgi:hypothetical protein